MLPTKFQFIWLKGVFHFHFDIFIFLNKVAGDAVECPACNIDIVNLAIKYICFYMTAKMIAIICL
jgi:hypothetical protein